MISSSEYFNQQVTTSYALTVNEMQIFDQTGVPF